MSIKRKYRLPMLLTVFISIWLSGCGNENQTGNSNTKIYYTAIESGSYYEGWASQLQEQAAAYGMSLDAGYAENSVETQNAQIKQAAANGYNVLMCGLVSPDTVTEIKASADNLPIVFINNAPEEEQLEQDRYIYVASDEYMAGQYQAEYILEQLGGREEINIAVLKGPKGASGTVGRTNGLKQTLKASGKKINYVFEDYADWNTDKAQELIELFLKTGKTLDCVAANNDDMALGALAAFEKAGMNTESILFLGVDASAAGCQAIAAGRMDFTVYQPMSSQIQAAVQAAQKLASKQSIKEIEGASQDGKYILLPFEKVDRGNVAQYQSE